MQSADITVGHVFERRAPTIFGERLTMRANLFSDRCEIGWRAAEVYPNAHNEGATHGLLLWDGGHGAFTGPGGDFCGKDWSREDAEAAARAWVENGVRPC